MSGACWFSALFTDSLLTSDADADADADAGADAGAGDGADAGALRRAVAMSQRLEVDHEGIGVIGSQMGARPA